MPGRVRPEVSSVAGYPRARCAASQPQFNGTVIEGRYAIETFGTNPQGEQVPVHGKLTDSGFHFIVTRSD